MIVSVLALVLATPAALNFTMNSLDGKPVDLAKYQGNVVLMVNVASQCGYTPQYEGLEELHKRYASRGLRLAGLPFQRLRTAGTREQRRDCRLLQKELRRRIRPVLEDQA